MPDPNPTLAPAPAPKAGDKPLAPAPATASGGTTRVRIERDYWPKGDNPNPVEEGPGRTNEWRVRAGEEVDLPADEALDVIEAGIGKRVKES